MWAELWTLEPMGALSLCPQQFKLLPPLPVLWLPRDVLKPFTRIVCFRPLFVVLPTFTLCHLVCL